MYIETMEEASRLMTRLNELKIEKQIKDLENKKFYDENKEAYAFHENLLLEYYNKNKLENNNFGIKFGNGFIDHKEVLKIKYDDLELIKDLEADNELKNYVKVKKEIDKNKFKADYKITETGIYSKENGEFISNKAYLEKVEEIKIKLE
jgi:hypothetical protein